MPKATVTASTDPVATGMRVASPRTSVMRPIEVAARAVFVGPTCEHGAGEVDADDARGAWTRFDGGDREVGSARAEVEHAL